MESSMARIGWCRAATNRSETEACRLSHIENDSLSLKEELLKRRQAEVINANNKKYILTVLHFFTSYLFFVYSCCTFLLSRAAFT